MFEKSFMNSRITTASMTRKEKILGYLVGPFGILALVAIVNQLLELYYTEVFYIDEIFGAGSYLMMTWVTKAVGISVGLLIAYVVEHNVSSQGRIRPMKKVVVDKQAKEDIQQNLMLQIFLNYNHLAGPPGDQQK